MQKLTLALPVAALVYSAIFDLTSIDTSGPVTFGTSKAETAADTFAMYGTLDASATGAAGDVNLNLLGNFAGTNGNVPVLPRELVDVAATWPFLLVQRLTGTHAGNLYATGNAVTSLAVVTSALPGAGTGYTGVLDLTSFGAAGVRIGLDKNATASDLFDVFLTSDSTVTSSVGCYYAGRISGGGNAGPNPSSVLVDGWPYAILQRAGGSTAGNAIASGVNAATAGGVSADVNPTASTLVERDTAGGDWNRFTKLGTSVAIYPGGGLIRISGAAETIIEGRNAADSGNIGYLTKDGADGVVLGDAVAGGTCSLATAAGLLVSLTGAGAITATAADGQRATFASTTSDLILNSTTGDVNLGTGHLGVDANVKLVRIATGNGALGSKTVVIGDSGGASQFSASAGSAGMALETGNGGAIDIGATAVVRTTRVATGAAEQTATFGSIDSTSTTTVDAGSGGLNLGRTGQKIIAVGNTTGTTQITAAAGSGGMDLTTSGGFSLKPYGVAAGNTTQLKFLELAAGGVNFTSFQAPDALAADIVYVLPSAAGVDGTKLTINTAGGVSTLSWT